MNNSQRTIKYIAMTFATLLAVGIISAIAGLFVNVLGVITGESFFGAEDRIDVALDFEEVLSLDIDNGSGTLNIKGGESFRVEAVNVPKSFLAELTDNGTLRIRGSKNKHILGFSFNWFGSRKSKITVYLPSDFIADSAKLSSGAGATTVDGLSAKSLIVSTGVGAFNGKHIVAGKARVDVGVGSMTISDTSFTDAYMDCGIGGLSYQGELLGSSTVDSGIGGVNLKLLGNRDDYNLKLDKGIGNARVNGKKSSGYDNNPDAENTLKVDSGIGEIRIQFND